MLLLDICRGQAVDDYSNGMVTFDEYLAERYKFIKEIIEISQRAYDLSGQATRSHRFTHYDIANGLSAIAGEASSAIEQETEDYHDSIKEIEDYNKQNGLE